MCQRVELRAVLKQGETDFGELAAATAGRVISSVGVAVEPACRVDVARHRAEVEVRSIRRLKLTRDGRRQKLRILELEAVSQARSVRIERETLDQVLLRP